MGESVRILAWVILGVICVVVAIALGWAALIVATGLAIYLIPLTLVVGGGALFKVGGVVGAVGLLLAIPGLFLSLKAYLKCRKCGFGLKLFWMCEFDAQNTYGTKCLRCGDLHGWWG